MDLLELYGLINTPRAIPSKPKVAAPVYDIPDLILEDQTKQATQPVMSSAIKALTAVHTISDYKRVSTSIQLLPDVSAEIDKLIFDVKEAAHCSITL